MTPSQSYIQVWLRLSWRNEYLTWNPSEEGEIDWLKVKPTDVWTPGVIPYNYMGQDDLTEKFSKLIMVDSNGTNNWYIPLVVPLSCDFDLKHFPFDVQKCSVQVSFKVFNHKSIVSFIPKIGMFPATLSTAMQNYLYINACTVFLNLSLKSQRLRIKASQEHG